jgi:hypothetical protein
MRSTGKVLHDHGSAVFQAARATALLLAVVFSKGICVVFGRRTRNQRFFTLVETGAPPWRTLWDCKAKIRQNKLGKRGKRLGAISADPLQERICQTGRCR